MQAKLLIHSELIVHSGLQFGGLLMYPTKQEHDGEPPMSWHCELGPHGDGTQGFVGVTDGRVGAIITNEIVKKIN